MLKIDFNRFKNKLDQMSLGDSNIAIIEEVYRQLQNVISSGKEIILIDRL